jgi:VIT1/CCC1 family predicted Fe2+/Mn2+ transporter
MSMAAGEYVSVSSQMDTERADLARETKELATQPAAELEELTQIYQARGLDRELASKVAEKLTATNALAAHAREELHISEEMAARPIQAALTSAATFATGAAMPMLVAFLAPQQSLALAVFASALGSLMILGAVGARAGNAGAWKAAVRVGFWGAIAMAGTAGIGRLVGTVV